jgi:aminodeoxyfutalosine synthase
MSKLLNRVRSLLERGERVPAEDGIELFGEKDLLALGKLARIPRERRYGSRAFLRRAHTVAYRGEHPEFMVEAAATEAPEGTEEIAIRCQLAADDTLAVWTDRLRAFARSPIPAVAQIGAGFVAGLAGRERLSPMQILEGLRAAGPVLLDGRDAELFDTGERRAIPRPVVSAEEWLSIHRSAHALGMKSSASMVYLVEDRPAAYAAHLDALRTAQDSGGGFHSFAPLAVHRQGVRNHLAMPTATQSLRTIAIARIMLDNIPHIVSAPSLVTAEVAVVALGFGADSVDTTIVPGDILLGEMPGGSLDGLQVIDAVDTSGAIGVDWRRIEERIIEGRFKAEAVDAWFEAGARVQ